VAVERAVDAVKAVDGSAVEFFREAARSLLKDSKGMPAEDVLAAALARITGHTEMRPRSLLTAHEDYVTLQFISPYDVEKPGFVFSFLKRQIGDDATVEEVKRMTLTADGKGAVFDVPFKLKDTFLSKCGQKGDDGGSEAKPSLSLPAALPKLKERPMESPGGFNTGYSGGGGGFQRDGGRGFDGRGGNGGRGGRGGGYGGSSPYQRGGRGGFRGRGR
jgi:ATP-dependent RNA helicase DDX21